MYAIGQKVAIRRLDGDIPGTVVETSGTRARVRTEDGRVLWVSESSLAVPESRIAAASRASVPARSSSTDVAESGGASSNGRTLESPTAVGAESAVAPPPPTTVGPRTVSYEWTSPIPSGSPFASPASAAKSGVLWALFSFSGRLGRSGFWLWSLVTSLLWFVMVSAAVVYLATVVTANAFVDDSGSQFPFDNFDWGSVGGFGVGLALAVFSLVWMGLALSVKRLHDRNYSGFVILVHFIPIFGPLWLFVQLGFLAGSPGTNRFGAEPS